MTTTISRKTLPRPESDRAESLRQLPPEVRSLVNAVMDAVLIWAAQQSNSNRDSNSLGGISHGQSKPHSIPEGSRLFRGSQALARVFLD